VTIPPLTDDDGDDDDDDDDETLGDFNLRCAESLSVFAQRFR